MCLFEIMTVIFKWIKNKTKERLFGTLELTVRFCPSAWGPSPQQLSLSVSQTRLDLFSEVCPLPTRDCAVTRSESNWKYSPIVSVLPRQSSTGPGWAAASTPWTPACQFCSSSFYSQRVASNQWIPCLCTFRDISHHSLSISDLVCSRLNLAVKSLQLWSLWLFLQIFKSQ